MHFYSFNVGDYRKDTAHLSLLEHGIYRMLLDTYYLDEKPLTLDHGRLMRSHSVRSADEVRAFENVLQDFFKKTEEGYRHKRCEQVIEAYQAKSESARNSAKARWGKDKEGELKTLDANAMRSHSEGNANHKPITNNYKKTGKENIKRKDERWEAQTELEGLGVEPTVARDWLSLRQGKKLMTTPTTISEIFREAGKAGLSMNRVLETCCNRGWAGFLASWVAQDGRITKDQAIAVAAETIGLGRRQDGPRFDDM